MLLNFYSLCRSERIWEEPGEFRPDKWEGEDLERIDPGRGVEDCAVREWAKRVPRELVGRDDGDGDVGELKLLHGFECGWAEGVMTAETVDTAESFGTTIPMRTRLRGLAMPRLPEFCSSTPSYV